MLTPSPSSERKYICYGGEQVFQQPYSAHDTQFYGFILPIEHDKRDCAQALLDRVFNQPSNGRVDFRLSTPSVLLSFQRFGSLSALNPPDAHKGGFAYSEATLWLSFVDHNRPGHPTSHFVPYIFADNHFAIAAGREVYGYPKARAEIEMPLSYGDDLNFRLTTEAIAHFSSTAMGKLEMLFEVTPVHTPQPPETPWQKWEQAVEHLVEHTVEDVADDVAEFVTKDLYQPEIPLVFLKQFRNAANGEFACYQAIVEGAGRVTDFKRGAPLGEFDVLINALDSHPVCAELGLEERTRAHGFFLEFSFDILPGQETSTAV